MKNIDDRLHNYAERLQEHTIRKRGNEPWYLELVASEKPKVCVVCGSRKNVQLHHKDGDWRNPWLHNVEWLCHSHHTEADRLLSQHKEKNMARKRKQVLMSVRRIKWTPGIINKMQKFYKKHMDEGWSAELCHRNFVDGGGYHSNRGAYNKYIRGYKRPGQEKPSVSYNTSSPSITLSQILKIQKVCESVGLKFFIDC